MAGPFLKGLSFAILLATTDAVPHQRSQSNANDGGCAARQRPDVMTVGKAVYFLTNDEENAVVALPISADGTLSNGSVTKTGGAGSIAINGATMQPGVPDALVGQSSLTVAENVSCSSLTNSRITDTKAEHLRRERRVEYAYYDVDFFRRSNSSDYAWSASIHPRRISQHCRRIDEEQPRMCRHDGCSFWHLLRTLLCGKGLGPNGCHPLVRHRTNDTAHWPDKHRVADFLLE